MRARRQLPLARPRHDQAEAEALLRVLASGTWSGPAGGAELRAFEQEMAALTGCSGAVGVNSGTVGLQFALQALGVRAGDEVITVSYTFVGTLNAIHQCGATPVLVDIDPLTLNIDPAAIEAALSPRTRALLLVHLFGRPAEADAVAALCRRHGLALVEDACEAPGARYCGRAVGGLGDAGVFGFYPNKPIAAGEGGMIVARDAGLLTTCRRLRNQGIDPDDGSLLDILPGSSARLSEWHAALGRVQLARLQQDLAQRAQVAALYRQAIAGDERIELPAPEAAHTRISWFTWPIRIRDIDAAARDRLIAALRAEGIGCAPYFRPAHTLPYHREHSRLLPLPVSEDIGRRCLGLPLHAGMNADDVGWVSERLRALLD